MKRPMTILCATLALGAGATTAVRQDNLPHTPFADTEAVTNLPCRCWEPSTRWFEVGMRLAATPSNCCEMAFGKDADGDGRLALDETAFAVAWECGRWVARGYLGETAGTAGRTPDLVELAWLPATTNLVTELEWAQAVRHRRPQGVAAKENGVDVFTSVDELAEPWFYDPEWDTVRISVRGVDDADERLTVRVRTTGVLIILK